MKMETILGACTRSEFRMRWYRFQCQVEFQSVQHSTFPLRARRCDSTLVVASSSVAKQTEGIISRAAHLSSSKITSILPIFLPSDGGVRVTFRRCHLLWAIIPHAWKRERRLRWLRRQLRRPRPSTFDRGHARRINGRTTAAIVYKGSTRGWRRRRGCTWFRKGESRGHNKTTTSPASRTAILPLLSLFPLSSPSFPPRLSFAFSPFLLPSLLKHRLGYRRTPAHLRQLIDISSSSRILVTKLPRLSIFTLINQGTGETKLKSVKNSSSVCPFKLENHTCVALKINVYYFLKLMFINLVSRLSILILTKKRDTASGVAKIWRLTVAPGW